MAKKEVQAGTADQEEYVNKNILLGKDRQRTLRLVAETIPSSPDRLNEDAFAISVDQGVLFAAYFDGATSLIPVKGLGNQTGARFASHFLRDNLSLAKSSMSPSEVMIGLNGRLSHASQQLEGAT